MADNPKGSEANKLKLTGEQITDALRQAKPSNDGDRGLPEAGHSQEHFTIHSDQGATSAAQAV